MDKPYSSTATEPQIPLSSSPQRRFWLRIKRRILRHVWLSRIALVLGAVAAAYLLIVFFGFILGKIGAPSYTKMLYNFVFVPKDKITSQNGRVNFLILGKAGAGHPAPDLTDTIIFASLSLDSPSAVLVSLPRDVWIPAIRAKLNSAYYWGKTRQEGGGLVLAKSSVEEIVGQAVHYGVVVDFSGFKGLVDVVGGIEVNVANSFVDEKYPIPGKENDECEGDPEFMCRYETVSFNQGKITMDGETALKFVRSRNAQGDEGTDLARAARQQMIIVALKNKILSPQVLLSPKKIWGVYGEMKKSIESDIDGPTAAVLVRLILGSRDSVEQHVVSEEFLENPPISPRYDNQYVFIPKDGNWEAVHDWVGCLLKFSCPEDR
jgi:LCP family protein required for cell wall assembly